MSNHPVNLVLRFALELVGLYAMGYWGWTTFDGPGRWLAVILLPLLAATLWGVFRVPNDGGRPVVQVSGWVRLALEVVFFSAAVLALFSAGQPTWGLALLGIVLVHYAVSYDRVLWLIRLR